MLNPPIGNWRRLVASVASMTPAIGVVRAAIADHHRGFPARDFVEAMLILTPLVLGAALIWSRRLGAQLLARGCWWCLLVVGTLGLAQSTGHNPERVWITGGVLCYAVALLAAGRAGLDESKGSFQPVAFRGTLMLSLVLAMADGVTLTFLNVVPLIDREYAAKELVFAALGLLTLLGIVGLIRLRTWGLLVALATNLLIGTLALTDKLPIGGMIRMLFIGTALAQLLVPLPMIVTLVRRRPPPPDRWGRFRSLGMQLAVLALAATCVYVGFFEHAPLQRFLK